MSSVLSPLMAWIRSPGHRAASAALLPAWTCGWTSQIARHWSLCGLAARFCFCPPPSEPGQCGPGANITCAGQAKTLVEFSCGLAAASALNIPDSSTWRPGGTRGHMRGASSDLGQVGCHSCSLCMCARTCKGTERHTCS